MLRRLILIIPILLAACGAGGDGAGGAATTDTDDDTRITAAVDWQARTITVRGRSDLDVAFCDGEAPVLCVADGGKHLGAIELATFPEEVTDFDAWAADFYDSIATDRAAHCDPSYELDGDDPVPVPFAGDTGVRYGFVGSTDGVAVERVLGYATSAPGSLHLLVANALSDDACLSRESELPLDVMPEIEPVLAAIAAGSRF